MKTEDPDAAPRYPWKEIPGSSHVILLERVLRRGSGLAVLDLGFGTGRFAERIRLLDCLFRPETSFIFPAPLERKSRARRWGGTNASLRTGNAGKKREACLKLGTEAATNDNW